MVWSSALKLQDSTYLASFLFQAWVDRRGGTKLVFFDYLILSEHCYSSVVLLHQPGTVNSTNNEHITGSGGSKQLEILLSIIMMLRDFHYFVALVVDTNKLKCHGT